MKGSAADFYIKEGDRSPALEVTCIDEDGAVVPLDAALSANFYMIDPKSNTPKIDGEPASIVAPPSSGKLKYVWGANDTDAPGMYDGEFRVNWSDGTPSTFPNFRYLRIRVSKSIETSD